MTKDSYFISKTELVTPIPPALITTQEFQTFMVETEKYISELPGSLHDNCFPLEHAFAEGTYIRTICIPANTFLVSRLHKFAYVSTILKGSFIMITSEGVVKVKAPQILISPANTKRLLYTFSEVVWTTVHPNPDNCVDIETLEARLTTRTYEGFEQKQIGMSEESMRCLTSFKNMGGI